MLGCERDEDGCAVEYIKCRRWRLSHDEDMGLEVQEMTLTLENWSKADRGRKSE